MLWLGAAALVTSSLGCSMCNTEHMCDYGGAGGKWQRGNPTCGRVGSILSDAGATSSATPAGYTENYGDSWGLVDGEPTPAVENFVMPEDLMPQDSMSQDLMPEAGSIMITP